MKKASRIFAVVICLAMLLTVNAFANWTTYGRTNSHNAVVTSAPTTSSATATEITLMNYGSGWDGVDTVPVMRTYNNITYAYVLYDGHAKGGHLAKIDCSATTPHTIWDKQVSGGSGFQLSTPLLVTASNPTNDAIYLASSLSDKYTLTNVSPSLPTSLTNGTQKTVTASISNLDTASNRVAIGIYLGNATTQGAISTTGTAVIDLGSTAVTLSLSPSGTNTGTSYRTYEQPVYDTSGNVVSYDYYWYINHNVTGTAGSAATVTAKITLTGGNGTIKYLDVYANQASVQKVTGLGATDAANVTNTTIYGGVNGQINTPITTDGTYLYFGTYTGYSTAGTYYQITKTGTLQGSFTPSSYGFYWAGAVVSGNYVYFGGDNGKLYYRSVSNFTNSGGVIDLTTWETNAGNVRSTIMLDNGYLYFTSQGGFLWCFQATTSGASHVWHATLGGTSTSTPTKVGNRIYVGCYGGASKSGVQCVDISGTTPVVTYVKQDSTLPVQCSIVVKGTGTGTDYLFFVTNTDNSTHTIGAGYCYSYSGGAANSGSLIWERSNHKTYSLGGMAIDNGKVVFGNDFNYLYVVR